MSTGAVFLLFWSPNLEGIRKRKKGTVFSKQNRSMEEKAEELESDLVHKMKGKERERERE